MQSRFLAGARRGIGLAFCMITLIGCAALVLTRAASSTPPPLVNAISGKSADDRYRQEIVGTWHDQYEGQRTLVVRPDGTATMVVEFDGYKARLFTPRLRIETTWTIEAGRFNRQTVGGEPADKVEFVKKRVGDRASDRIVQLTEGKMLLVDQDDRTKYDWRRAP